MLNAKLGAPYTKFHAVIFEMSFVQNIPKKSF